MTQSIRLSGAESQKAQVLSVRLEYLRAAERLARAINADPGSSREARESARAAITAAQRAIHALKVSRLGWEGEGE